MKNSILLQSLTLIGAVVIIVRAATISTPTKANKNILLEYILDEATHLKEKYPKEMLKEKVKDPSLGTPVCQKCFFVGVEKSLEMIRLNGTKLYKYVHKYNKDTKIKMNCTTYHLDKKKMCTLENLLTKIADCAKGRI